MINLYKQDILEAVSHLQQTCVLFFSIIILTQVKLHLLVQNYNVRYEDSKRICSYENRMMTKSQ